MEEGLPSDRGSGLFPPVAAGCRAKQIAGVKDFAQCLVEPATPCQFGFSASGFFYCEHPRREAIIVRTLAAEGPP